MFFLYSVNIKYCLKMDNRMVLTDLENKTLDVLTFIDALVSSNAEKLFIVAQLQSIYISNTVAFRSMNTQPDLDVFDKLIKRGLAISQGKTPIDTPGD